MTHPLARALGPVALCALAAAPLDGGEARRLTAAPEGVFAFEFSPDRGSLGAGGGGAGGRRKLRKPAPAARAPYCARLYLNSIDSRSAPSAPTS